MRTFSERPRLFECCRPSRSDHRLINDSPPLLREGRPDDAQPSRLSANEVKHVPTLRLVSARPTRATAAPRRWPRSPCTTAGRRPAADARPGRHRPRRHQPAGPGAGRRAARLLGQGGQGTLRGPAPGAAAGHRPCPDRRGPGALRRPAPRRARTAVVVADPARGVEKLSREEFCRRWTGYLLLVVPEPRRAAAAPARRRRSARGAASWACCGGTRAVLVEAVRLRPADDAAGHLHLVLRPAPGRFGAGPPRGAAAQRPGHRHGADRGVPHAVRHAAAVPAGPRRPQGRPGADRRLRPAHPAAAAAASSRCGRSARSCRASTTRPRSARRSAARR